MSITCEGPSCDYNAEYEVLYRLSHGDIQSRIRCQSCVKMEKVILNNLATSMKCVPLWSVRIESERDI